MSTIQYLDSSLFSSAIKGVELVKPSVYRVEKFVWINGQSHSGKPKTVILGLYHYTKEFTTCYALLIDQGKVRYSSTPIKNRLNITTPELTTIWGKLTNRLAKEPILEGSTFISGDRIGRHT